MSLTSHFPVNIPLFTRPFAIKKSLRPEDENDEDAYFVDKGVCFSTFSFETGSYLPIKGLGTGTSYTLGNNKKIFIQIDILPNLQIS